MKQVILNFAVIIKYFRLKNIYIELENNQDLQHDFLI